MARMSYHDAIQTVYPTGTAHAGFSGNHFFFVFSKLNYFAFFFLHVCVTQYTVWRPYMAYVDSKQHPEIFSEI